MALTTNGSLKLCALISHSQNTDATLFNKCIMSDGRMLPTAISITANIIPATNAYGSCAMLQCATANKSADTITALLFEYGAIRVRGT